MSRAVLVALLMLAAPAVADRSHVDAEKHKQAGADAYMAGDFETARRELAAAYEIEPTPALLFAWAQSERQAGHCEKALPLYRQYLATNPARVDGDNTRLNIVECEHKVPTSPAPPLRDEPPPETPGAWYDHLAMPLAIGGVVAVVVGVSALAESSSTVDNANANVGMYNLQMYDDELHRAATERTLAVVAIGTGTAAIGGAIAVYVLHRRTEATVATNGHALLIGGRF